MDKNIRILIVDDFSTMRRIVKNLLNDLGFFNTAEADDGVTALVELKKAPYDLVVTDWNMPGMPGIDLLKAIRADASLAKIPVITTASVPQGPNGPLIPEIHQNAPHAKYVARKGQINAWDNPDFVDAVKATGKGTLIVAGTITSVCMAFPSISAVADGYRVFAVVDASGTYSKMAQEITLARIVQAGVVPIDTGAVLSELQKTWNRDDAQQWAQAYAGVFPPYQLLIESYLKAQEVVTNHEQLDSQRK